MIKHIVCALLACGLGLASLFFTCYLIYNITTLGELTTDIKIILWCVIIASYVIPFAGTIYIWRIYHE